MNKHVSDTFRNRKPNATEPVKAIDCNGGISISQSQRSDHIPLLVNTNRKRWHSLEMVRAPDVDHEISGCEDLIDNSKKSLGRNIIKSWLVGMWQSSNGLKSSPRNGSGILLQQTPPVPTKPDKETSIVWATWKVSVFFLTWQWKVCSCFYVETHPAECEDEWNKNESGLQVVDF